jgi:phospholipid-binding lipoprotein MlaA
MLRLQGVWIRTRKTGKTPANHSGFDRMRRGLVLALCGLAVCQLLAACATAPSPQALAANDPWEAENREVLKFNAKVDTYFVIPTVGLYFLAVPEPGRRGVHNFLGHLSLPIVFVNDVLQGETTKAGHALGRIVVNSTFGLGGFFDPAVTLGLPPHREDMGQTLAVHGVQEGPYMVLPFFGPSNPRDAVGLATDLAIDPTNFIPMKQHIWWAAGRAYFTILDLRSQNYQTLQDIQRTSIDYYSSLRSFYRQYRDQQIANGRQPETPAELPDF